jgi:hypothetical protein
MAEVGQRQEMISQWRKSVSVRKGGAPRSRVPRAGPDVDSAQRASRMQTGILSPVKGRTLSDMAVELGFLSHRKGGRIKKSRSHVDFSVRMYSE